MKDPHDDSAEQGKPDALALLEQAEALSEGNDHAGAAAATGEAIEILQEWIREDTSYLVPLAGAFNNLSIHLSALDEPQRALEAAQRAVDTYPRLPALTALDKAYMAAALTTLARCLAVVDERGQSIDAYREAVTACRSIDRNHCQDSCRRVVQQTLGIVLYDIRQIPAGPPALRETLELAIETAEYFDCNLPEGQNFFYRVAEEVDGHVLTYDLTLPSRITQVNLAAVSLSRHGGDHPLDEVFRRDLYYQVGAITVASGHAEAAMKRLLIVLSGGEGRFSLVDMTWTDLVRELRNHCDGSDLRRIELSEILDWAHDARVKENRDNVIHGYWWHYYGVGVRVSRFYRRKDGATLLGSLSDVKLWSDQMFEYANRLEKLTVDQWPRAILPRLKSTDEGGRACP